MSATRYDANVALLIAQREPKHSRRTLHLIRERIAALPIGHHYAAGVGEYDAEGRNYGARNYGMADLPVIEVRLTPAADGGVLLDCYQWAYVPAGRDGEPRRWRSL